MRIPTPTGFHSAVHFQTGHSKISRVRYRIQRGRAQNFGLLDSFTAPACPLPNCPIPGRCL
jgi:hypothetical protein